MLVLRAIFVKPTLRLAALARVLPNFTDTSKKPANALALTSGAEVVIIVRCAQLRILIAPWRLAPGSEQGFGGKLLNPME